VYADCRYNRQDIQIPCTLEIDSLDDGYAARLREQFEAEHSRRYGFGLDAPVEIATLRVVGRGVMRDIELELGAEQAVGEPPVDRTERVHFDGTWHEANIYERDRLQVGHRIEGPAIVEQEDTTTVIEPGYAGTVDAARNIIIREGNR
jgi:N-methylhydantoinase A